MSRKRTWLGAIGTACALGMPDPALAQRIETQTLTCSAVQDLVRQRQAVTLYTGRNTYDRYVANSRPCGVQARAANAFAPTKDQPACRLQTCRSRRSSDGSR